MDPNRTITVNMTVHQLDLARHSLRSAAKRRQRDADKGNPIFTEKNGRHAEDLRRVVTVVSDAMRRELGEVDYRALGFEHAGQQPVETQS